MGEVSREQRRETVSIKSIKMSKYTAGRNPAVAPIINEYPLIPFDVDSFDAKPTYPDSGYVSPRNEKSCPSRVSEGQTVNRD
jgi:hypothetical protein